MGFEKPKKVRDAQKLEDSETLTELGRRGAKKANRKKALLREQKSEQNEVFKIIDKEKSEQEEWDRKVEANEHIAPIDPEEKN